MHSTCDRGHLVPAVKILLFLFSFSIKNTKKIWVCNSFQEKLLEEEDHSSRQPIFSGRPGVFARNNFKIIDKSSI